MIADKALLRKITGKAHRDAQLRELVHLGITHKVRSDGTILVSEAHVERLLGGLAKSKVATPAEPNWNALAETT